MGDIASRPWVGNEEGILYADADLEATIQGRLVHDFGVTITGPMF